METQGGNGKGKIHHEEESVDFFKESIGDVHVFRFEKGDFVSVNASKNDGVFSVEATEGGFTIAFLKRIVCVTDSMLEDAKLSGKKLNSKYFTSAEKKNSLLQMDTKTNPSLKVYTCSCLNRYYDNITYAKWIQNESRCASSKNPPGWPSTWKNGFCDECKSFIRIAEGESWL